MEKKKLNALSDKCKKRGRKGKAAEVIVNSAKKTGAGLIVMGAFNRNPVYELFFGSTTLNVLDHAPCPVLTVRDPEHDFLQPAFKARRS